MKFALLDPKYKSIFNSWRCDLKGPIDILKELNLEE